MNISLSPFAPENFVSRVGSTGIVRVTGCYQNGSRETSLFLPGRIRCTCYTLLLYCLSVCRLIVVCNERVIEQLDQLPLPVEGKSPRRSICPRRNPSVSARGRIMASRLVKQEILLPDDAIYQPCHKDYRNTSWRKAVAFLSHKNTVFVVV